jgi:hypothetical protein
MVTSKRNSHAFNNDGNEIFVKQNFFLKYDPSMNHFFKSCVMSLFPPTQTILSIFLGCELKVELKK